MPDSSANFTKIRLLATSNGTVPVPVTKIAKVGVAFWAIVVVTEPAIALVHCPVEGFVWQSAMLTGSVTEPVSAVAVMAPVAPTLTVATAKAAEPVAPGTLTMPSLLIVAANATTSGIGVADAEKSRVLTPGIVETGAAFVPQKSKVIVVLWMAAVGVNEITKVCPPPGGMSTAVFTVPVTAFVLGSVIWNAKPIGSPLVGVILTAVALV